MFLQRIGDILCEVNGVRKETFLRGIVMLVDTVIRCTLRVQFNVRWCSVGTELFLFSILSKGLYTKYDSTIVMQLKPGGKCWLLKKLDAIEADVTTKNDIGEGWKAGLEIAEEMEI